MDLSKLFEMQRELDQRIVKEKGLEGQDLIPNTFLALLVELSEFANEGRWFKHWSNNRTPRTEGMKPVKYSELNIKAEPYNPLLVEYVDGLHFFLSIANQKGWHDAMYLHEEAIFDLEEKGFDGGLTGAFLEMKYFLLRCYMETGRDEKIEQTLGYSKQEYCFRSAWFIFVALGIVGFGFTPEQIEEAYLEKNAVNHARQENGY